jgi:hypothetical protein
VKKPKVVVDGELCPEVLPLNIGQFVDLVMKHTMVGFSKAFDAPACWFGGGFGGTPASQFTSPGNERLIAIGQNEVQKNAALGRLFNALNLYLCRLGSSYFDKATGKALGRVSVFGISLPNQPHTMAIAGAGHAVSRFSGYFATAYCNSIEIMSFKMGLRQSTDKPLLISEVPDSRRWIDCDGHVTAFEPKYWDVEELRKKYPEVVAENQHKWGQTRTRSSD